VTIQGTDIRQGIRWNIRWDMRWEWGRMIQAFEDEANDLLHIRISISIHSFSAFHSPFPATFQPNLPFSWHQTQSDPKGRRFGNNWNMLQTSSYPGAKKEKHASCVFLRHCQLTSLSIESDILWAIFQRRGGHRVYRRGQATTSPKQSSSSCPIS
jgi:hypothetical protein